MPKKQTADITTLHKSYLQDVPTKSITPHPDNPRLTDDGVSHVKDSLVALGYLKISIGIDENRVLLYGHTTLRAFQELADENPDKWGKIKNPLVVPEVTQIFGLSDDEKKAYRIADNRTGEFTAWNAELLVRQLQELEASNFNIAAIGFNQFNIQDMLAEMKINDADSGLVPGNDGDDEMFPEYDGTTTTQHRCPKCGFEWNGNSGQKEVKPVTLKERMMDDYDPDA